MVCFAELFIICFNFTLFSNNIYPILNFELSEINYLFLFILIGIMCLLLLIALLIVVALLRFVAIFMLFFTLDICVCVNVTVKVKLCINGDTNGNVENGSEPILCINVGIAIDTMLNLDGDANFKCEQTFSTTKINHCQSSHHSKNF